LGFDIDPDGWFFHFSPDFYWQISGSSEDPMNPVWQSGSKSSYPAAMPQLQLPIFLASCTAIPHYDVATIGAALVSLLSARLTHQTMPEKRQTIFRPDQDA
jgi:hypothetical protein